MSAVQKQVATMDYAPTFNMGHPLAFEYAHRLTTELLPGKVGPFGPMGWLVCNAELGVHPPGHGTFLVF